MNRRDFIEKTTLGISGVGITSKYVKPIVAPFHQVQPQPTAAQKAWMQLKFGMFIHFGINTYYNVEWSDGSLDPSKVNPVNLDTDQWCKVAKAAGMKYIVIVTKHHDGFCLWPSKQTNYSIASTPFKKDILAALANSAHKHGLKLGFYYSLWDRHEKSHDTNINVYVNDFMLPQLHELMTGYGPVVEIWFDGFWKYQKNGWTQKNTIIDGEATKSTRDTERDNAFVQSWRNEGAYWWQMDRVYQQLKQWQPECLVMNNSTSAFPGVPLHPVDIRSGEKYTEVHEDRKVWNWLGKDVYLPLQIETTMSVKGDEKFPSGNWFWHEWDKSILAKEQIQQYLKVADSMQANLLLNVGISDKGTLRPEDESTLLTLQS